MQIVFHVEKFFSTVSCRSQSCSSLHLNKSLEMHRTFRQTNFSSFFLSLLPCVSLIFFFFVSIHMFDYIMVFFFIVRNCDESVQKQKKNEKHIEHWHIIYCNDNGKWHKRRACIMRMTTAVMRKIKGNKDSANIRNK